MSQLYDDAMLIIKEAIDAANPETAVKKALSNMNRSSGKVVLISVGKAAWQMARAANEVIGGEITRGVVITKYGHVRGEIVGMDCYEAGHPIPDDNSVRATEKAIEAISDLTENDRVIFLLSGGGSSLFEKPLIPIDELAQITSELIGSGADIVEINIVRKRLSAVKGGKFALLCRPAQVFAIVLSDILGAPLDMIASGPVYPDESTCEQAKEIVKKYNIKISEEAKKLLGKETPKHLENIDIQVMGSVRQLCTSAIKTCKKLGYNPIFLTDELCCLAREAGSFIGTIAKSHSNSANTLAFIAGGETVVKIEGTGKGGRNQEIVLSAARYIAGLQNVAVFSVGSDGTDGPTDAAGGYVDGNTYDCLKAQGIKLVDFLDNNDSYNALRLCGGLIFTGPTGTNVNDLTVALIKQEKL